MAARKPQNCVKLVAEDADGVVIEKRVVSIDEYYEGLLPIVDSADYRKEKEIRLLRGQIYGIKGNLMQEFVVEYGADGSNTRRRAVFDDGTIVEN